MQAESKKGLCYKCKNVIEIPVTECLTQCDKCSENLVFLCHIIKCDFQPKLKISCEVCHSSYTLIMCPRCKGYSAIRNFMSGFSYECPCSYRSTFVICNACLRILSLPSNKNYEKTKITCKACRNQFKYKICTSCKADIYKPGIENNSVYKCPNPECPESNNNNNNQNYNPYENAEQVNQQLNGRVSEAIQKSKNRESWISDKQLCKVCLDKEANMINVKCYHLAVCQECSPAIKKQCPICRAKGQYKKVFKS